MTGKNSSSCDVLIVDDDRLVIWVIEENVRLLGCNVHIAENGYRALEMLKRTPAIGLMVTDILMPLMNGNDLIREALALRPDLRIVIVTGAAGDETTQHYPTVRKPFHPRQLQDVISEALPR